MGPPDSALHAPTEAAWPRQRPPPDDRKPQRVWENPQASQKDARGDRRCAERRPDRFEADPSTDVSRLERVGVPIKGGEAAQTSPSPTWVAAELRILCVLQATPDDGR